MSEPIARIRAVPEAPSSLSTLTINYVVRTAAGAAMHTFDRPEAALKHARGQRLAYPGCYVESVTVSTTTRRLWTDRKAEPLARAS